VEELCDQIALIVRGRIVAIGTAAELEAGVGPGADLDDVFNKLVGIESESEAVKSYAEVRRGATPRSSARLNHQTRKDCATMRPRYSQSRVPTSQNFATTRWSF
jgi:ABC-type multidrug transport system ATPase subunit